MAMQKRQSHKKSSRGCQNCKKRHVKCDEQGPPCAGCVIRNTDCVYLNPPDTRGKNSRSTSLTRRPKKSSTAANSLKSSSSSSSSSDDSRGQSPNDLSSHSSVTRASPLRLATPASISPLAFSTTPDSHRLLELELVHRWSTRTWQGLYSIPEDQPYLQSYVPRTALRNSYLMNGILATAAMDLARNSGGGKESSKYFCAALEYSNQASEDFRTELVNINADNISLLYHFAMFAAVYNFVMTNGQMNTMDRISTMFDMILGAYNIVLTNVEWALRSPSTLPVVLTYGLVSMDVIDPETRTAIDRLSSVAREIRVPSARDIAADGTKTEDSGSQEEFPLASEVYMYRLAVGHLKYCFAEDARNKITGYCLSLLTATGRDFAVAFKNREPMCLFVMMHFGVLLDRLKNTGMGWWLTSAGRELVSEVSEILAQSPMAQLPDAWEGICWTREQVGLPPLMMNRSVSEVTDTSSHLDAFELVNWDIPTAYENV